MNIPARKETRRANPSPTARREAHAIVDIVAPDSRACRASPFYVHPNKQTNKHVEVDVYDTVLLYIELMSFYDSVKPDLPSYCIIQTNKQKISWGYQALGYVQYYYKV
jgi:hypothetical protein